MVEEIEIKSLNGGIKKKFTSLATNATLFRWDFGDGTGIHDVTINPYIYEFTTPGIYQVNHQSCYFSGDTLCCSLGWCTKSVNVQPEVKNVLPWLGFAGLLGFIILRKECEEHTNKKDCEEAVCQWLEKQKKCVKKCKEEYKLSRTKEGFSCIPSKPVHKK